MNSAVSAQHCTLGAWAFTRLVGVQHADALADGRFVISVSVASKERQRVAANLLNEHGSADVHFVPRYTITAPMRAD